MIDDAESSTEKQHTGREDQKYYWIGRDDHLHSSLTLYRFHV